MKIIPFDRSYASEESCEEWDYKKNILKPEEVRKNSHKKYWFKCKVCSHSYDQSLGDRTSGQSCSYCGNKQLCDCEDCFKKSYASEKSSEEWDYEKNILKPKEVFKNSDKKYWFICKKCFHSYEQQLKKRTLGQSCPYCNNKKLCNCEDCFKKSYASEKSNEEWDYTSNELKPEEVFKNRNQKFWFICKKCSHSYEQRLNDRTSSNYSCPLCVNKTEQKLNEFLNPLNFNHQVKFDWCKDIRNLPFDFCNEELKIIIELDGEQHFSQRSNWRSPQEQQEVDEYKMLKALEYDYSVIRLLQDDVLFDKNNWQEKLKSLIKKYDYAQIFYIDNDDKYKNEYIKSDLEQIYV